MPRVRGLSFIVLVPVTSAVAEGAREMGVPGTAGAG